MKILVIGGMHGNEPLGIKLIKLLKEKPINGIAAILANEKAVKKNCRFINYDINRIFPGDNKSDDYETKRAAEILSLGEKSDLVLDFHNTKTSLNDCSLIGNNSNQDLEKVSFFFGLKRVIIAHYDCINKYAPNCLSIEISLDSALNNISFWYDKIKSLQLGNLNQIKNIKVEKYNFVYRITIADRDRLMLKDKNLLPFKPIDKKLAKAMGVKTPAYPIFIGKGYTPDNYGGILNKIN